ncbi:MAG TPA: RHS repeat-associated core domain-containing protein [Luteibacter sp.]|uniref:RHS repeat-associated core domain-containing protein n=1 Tax=Luteibacter sp. TaxID=1886636 RepID=UPI002C99FF12|nr:RHS repeat-associated core domain-containing protein [Luteibacter sp.]HVI55320.1 RHS repeat-associated core domain-containing protein [Luteibacter sp.]
MSASLHRHTPQLSAVDARGLPVRSVAYDRLQVADEPIARIRRQTYDATGHATGQWDARLWADGGEAGEPNQRAMHSLSSRLLRSVSVDAGWRMGLFDGSGQAREGWDGRGTHRWSDYDAQLRLVSVHEQWDGGLACCTERLHYGNATEAATNRCGRMVRYDDPAGSLAVAAYDPLGEPRVQTQRFLANPVVPDWPVAEAARDALLEHDVDGSPVAYTTQWIRDALAASLSQLDAMGNERTTRYDVAGQLLQAGFTPVQAASVEVFHHPAYNAAGRMISGTAGNGVVTTAIYSIVDDRLQALEVRRTGATLQDLIYTYDPMGHVLRVEDLAQPTDWFSGAQVEPVCAYRYDTLYRLVEAGGRESVLATVRPGLPELGGPGGTVDASRLRNYTQTYTYDAGDNLLTLRHASGGPTQYTRTMTAEPRSNRCLPDTDPNQPPDFDMAFDANGNLLRLEGTQAVQWNARNQLQKVTQVLRGAGANDDEVYVYDGAGQRRRKRRVTQARATRHVSEVRYLPGLEIRSDTATGEVVHVIDVQAGRNRVRHLRWVTTRAALPPAQWRYSLDDRLGGSSLELDELGAVISHEGYYPYGGTAWWAARSAIEASYKTVRYSGKERDATGLYDYGFRYYVPWLCRWASPDPAGNVDGINLYRMVANNPASYSDTDGRQRTPIDKSIHQIWIGDRPDLLKTHVDTINRNVETASDYRFVLHMDVNNPDAYAETVKELRVHEINWLSLEDGSAPEFSGTWLFNLYDDFRMKPENLAFAADTLRIPLIRKKGGFYLDVDDVLANSHASDDSQAPFSSGVFEAAPDEVLTMQPVGVPWEQPGSPESIQLNNSFFAAHASNRTLERLEQDMVKKYDEARDSGAYSQGGSMEVGEYLAAHRKADRVQILSGIVGTRVFTDTIAREDAEIGEHLSIVRSVIAHGPPRGFDLAAFEERMNQKMPLSRYNTVGSNHSWR